MALLPEDHLDSEQGFFDAPEYVLGYHLAVRRVLLPDPNRLLQMVVLPSFGPEVSIYVLGGRCAPRGLKVVTGQMVTQIWGEASERHLDPPDSRGVRVSRPPSQETFRTISPPVDWARAPLGDQTFEHLSAAWEAALAAAHPRDGTSVCVDGVSYHFACGMQAAMTHSPRPGTVCAELVALGAKLIDLARLTEEAERPAREAVIAVDADRLLARIRQN